MTVSIEDLIRWRPERFSEDHLTNFVRKLFNEKTRWHVAYCNPPGGSWKEVVLIKNSMEYLQEIHKSGEGVMKRPDVVAQYLSDEEGTRLLLFESKQEKSSWDPDLPTMMRQFFERQKDDDEPNGIRNFPFWHRRERGSNFWETIPEHDPDRDWFTQGPVEYVYGFGYMIGPTHPSNISEETDWIKKQLADYNEVPPIVVITVGWDPETFEPYTVPVFSDTFPTDLSNHLKTILPTASESGKTTLSDFD